MANTFAARGRRGVLIIRKNIIGSNSPGDVTPDRGAMSPVLPIPWSRVFILWQDGSGRRHELVHRPGGTSDY
jgi:hypothetical protein